MPQELFVNPGRIPLWTIKVWMDDPAAVETQGEALKCRYAQIFRM